MSGVITLTQGHLEINNNLTISGPSATTLAISGNNLSTVFQIDSGFMVNISAITVKNGTACTSFSCNGDGGGGIRNKGILVLTNVVVSDSSTGCNCNAGGGIRNDGTLMVTNSTLSGNFAAYGGAIGNGGTATVTNTTFSVNGASFGGAIANFGSGTVTVTNATFSGNSSVNGGGIWNTGTLTVTNSTFSGNSAANGGGGVFNSSFLTLKNTVLANSGYGNCFGTATSSGYNLSDDNSCAGFLTQTGDLNNTPAGLDPGGLKDNGGPTQTIALLSTSSAVDAIPVSPVNYCTDVAGHPVTTDQRGVTRPQGPACDIGAFELVQYSFAPLAFPTQAMEGDLKLNPGDTLRVGYDFTMPGSHPSATVRFSTGQVSFPYTCVSGSGAGNLIVPFGAETYPDNQNSSAWVPSGNQQDPSVFQGQMAVPDLCSGNQVRFQQGGTFSTGVCSTDSTNKVNVRWHYSGNGSAGGWSGTKSVVPAFCP